MNNVNLIVTTQSRLGAITSQAVMIDAVTPVALLDWAVRTALMTQTHIEPEDCYTILKISYTPEGK